MNKILCKKNYIWKKSKKSLLGTKRFKEGQLYRQWADGNSLIDDVGYYIIRTDAVYCCDKNYFFTPDETKNILRTKLMDKMLNEESN